MRQDPVQPHSEQAGSDLLRVQALSDGLFAIVLTLLVLDLRIPVTGSPAGAEVLRQMVALWPRMFTFVLTFLVAGVYWSAHRMDFEYIVRGDRRLLGINLMFLLSVSILPFTTSLLGGRSDAFTWAVYAADMATIGLTLAAVWGYAVAQGLVAPDITPAIARATTIRHLVVPAVFLLSAIVAQFDASLAFWFPFLIPVGQRLTRRLPARRLASPERPMTAAAFAWRAVSYLPLLGFAAWSVYALGLFRP